MNIIIQSKNQKAIFEQYQKSFQRSLNITIIFIVGLFFAAAFYPEIYNHFVRYLAYRVKVFTFPVKMMIIIIGGVVMYFLTANSRSAIKEFEKYIVRCSKEFLIVDSEKISGETEEGDFKLYFNQIQNTQLLHESIPADKRIKQLDISILVIQDIVGNEFSFKTFSNSRELKHFIDEAVENI